MSVDASFFVTFQGYSLKSVEDSVKSIFSGRRIIISESRPDSYSDWSDGVFVEIMSLVRHCGFDTTHFYYPQYWEDLKPEFQSIMSEFRKNILPKYPEATLHYGSDTQLYSSIADVKNEPEINELLISRFDDAYVKYEEGLLLNYR